MWGSEQERVFNEYDLAARSKVSADASSFGLGAVLLQESSPGKWRPVVYASHYLSETERRYVQIEKEALVVAVKSSQTIFLGVGLRLRQTTNLLDLFSVASI